MRQSVTKLKSYKSSKYSSEKLIQINRPELLILAYLFTYAKEVNYQEYSNSFANVWNDRLKNLETANVKRTREIYLSTSP